jgi:hypothetical protein
MVINNRVDDHPALYSGLFGEDGKVQTWRKNLPRWFDVPPPIRSGFFGAATGGGATAPAALGMPPRIPPSTPPIDPPGMPPGTPPATPPERSSGGNVRRLFVNHRDGPGDRGGSEQRPFQKHRSWLSTNQPRGRWWRRRRRHGRLDQERSPELPQVERLCEI